MTAMAHDLVRRLTMCPTALVRPKRDQGVVHVDKRYDARTQRNLFSLESARVTGAIPFFMMRARNANRFAQDIALLSDL